MRSSSPKTYHANSRASVQFEKRKFVDPPRSGEGAVETGQGGVRRGSGKGKGTQGRVGVGG
jgi:hypothetical protein